MTTVSVPRREQLLDAAAVLFAERGFHDVGMDDIGAAAGISGPGVYRHFAGKLALLEALVDSAMTQMLAGARRQRAEHSHPERALHALVELHAHFAVEQRALIGVWVRETRALSDGVRHTLRQQMRAYEQPWQQVLAELRPDLSAAEVATVVSTTLAMLNGTAITTPLLQGEPRQALLRRMALAALAA